MAFNTAIDKLKDGQAALIHPKGNSMTPLIKSGDPVLLFPVNNGTYSFGSKVIKELEKGDIVLVKVKGSVYLHKITSIKGDQVQIGNNKGHINGWTTKNKVYGIRIKS